MKLRIAASLLLTGWLLLELADWALGVVYGV